ncbi:bis(5'-nucleosyl)-tetraphosphatase (symmetrical) YqeK [Virgibacillus sp. LDC-1]|uniref:bis(5'-nucleosyl)-tetraphosphatase (symmetrical) YqeK n=1 Tax=Virgibacillus sp. LDC-1 TaxID=3039856 RepID=UPI0024DEA921|nr:bis(5'-nucleosyl)-tetraphosphatase (symmetrical) YqeK [Virgibacillus sp. LDC-1]
METSKALRIVKPHLTSARYEHTERVMETAVHLAKLYGSNEEKAAIAAVFHDYAKYRNLDEMKKWILSSYLPKDLLHYHHELWHGPVGSLLVEREHGIIDPEIKDAIYYHTTGRAHMSTLEKVLFVADYIEPGRSFSGLEEVRDTANRNLDKAAWLVSRNTIQFLMGKENTIYPDTFHAYNDLTNKLSGGN